MPSIKPYMGDKNHVSLDDVCFLVTMRIVRDELLQQIQSPWYELVYCSIVSIGQKEFAATMRAGLKAELTLIINHDEYDGQKAVEYNRVTYSIYRTFVRNDGNIELYCEVRTGGN